MTSIHIRAKHRLLLSVAVFGTLLPGVAVAQTASQDAASQTATGSTSEQGGVEEIIVTAQRREESQQDVPISITTVTAAGALKSGVSGTETLGIAVPSLQFGRQAGIGAAPYLRGVGTNSASPGTESPVAVYVDDVYIGSAAGAIFQFNNINSVEVLKGPQGTLFGRNATGGVVHVRTKQPAFEPALDVTAGFSSYDTYSGSLYATGGLSDTLAVSVAATGYDQTKGYGRAVYSGDDIYKSWNFGIRGQLLWRPSVDTKIILSTDYSRGNSDQGFNPTIEPGTVATGGATFPGRYRSTNDPTDISKNTSYGFSGKIDHDFGPVSIVSISAYRDVSQFTRLDSDGSLRGGAAILTVPNNTNYARSFSQELQLLSNSEGPFSWILGGFYYHSKAAFDPIVFAGAAFAALGGSSITYGRQTLDSYSGFGEASYKLASGTKLTLGIRYTTEDMTQNILQTTGTGVIRAPSPFEQNDSFSKLTYRAILDQKIGESAMVYASYSRGFKSGAYNLNAPTITVAGVPVPAAVVSPEVIDSFEIGLKSQFLDDTLRLNVSGFQYEYDNLQISSIQNSAAILLNAAKARIKGIDVDFNFAPTRRLSIGGGISFLDSKFTEFPAGPLYVPNPSVCTPVPMVTGPLTGGNRTCAANLAGNQTPRSPKFTGSINATYTLPTKVGKFALTGSLYHNAGYFWEPDNRYKQPRHDLLNTSLTWVSPSSKYEFRIYAKNLLNEYYFAYFSESTTRDSGSPEMPRSYGVSVSAHF